MHDNVGAFFTLLIVFGGSYFLWTLAGFWFPIIVLFIFVLGLNGDTEKLKAEIKELKRGREEEI